MSKKTEIRIAKRRGREIFDDLKKIAECLGEPTWLSRIFNTGTKHYREEHNGNYFEIKYKERSHTISVFYDDKEVYWATLDSLGDKHIFKCIVSGWMDRIKTILREHKDKFKEQSKREREEALEKEYKNFRIDERKESGD